MRSARMVRCVVGAAVVLGVVSGEASAALISGRLSWGGVPVTGPATATMYVRLWCDLPSIEGPKNVPVQLDGTYSVEYSPVGTCHLSVLLGRPNEAGGAQVAFLLVPLLPGPTDFDLTSASGWVRGTVTGQAVAEVNYHAPVDGEGRFEFLGPPGLLSLRPVAASGDEIGPYSFTFPVVAGQTTDLGTLATGAASEGWGALTAETTWRGQPVFLPGLFVAGGRTVVASESPPTSVGLFPAGPLELAFLADDMPRPCPGGCLNSKPKLAHASVVVSAAQTSHAQVELGGTLGRLRGELTLDGVSVPFENPMPHGPTLRLRPGSVDLLLVAGTYTIGVEIADPVVNGGEPVLVGELTFSITAGETTNLGSRDFHDAGRGYVSATATWNGGPLYGDNIGAAPVVLTGPTLHAWFYSEGITMTVGQLAVGTPETLEVHSGGCGVHGDASDRVGQVSVTVPSANQALPLPLDLTSWAGRVVGTVEIDGQRPDDDWRPVVIGVDGSPCFWKPTNGIFNVLLAPGLHTITVRDFEDIVHLRPLAQLSVTVAAGTITDMGLIAVTTPSDATDAGVSQDPPPDGGTAGDGGAGVPGPGDPPACVPRGAEMCNEVDDDCDGRINQGLSCAFEFATVRGTTTWGGAPIAGIGVAALGQPAEADPTSGNFLFRTKFVPGPLPLELTNGEGCVVSHLTANVVTPATETSLDLTPSVGHLVGSLRWNDRVLLDPWVNTRCGFEIDANSGKIGGYPQPGTSTLVVCDAASDAVPCSTFSFLVRAGEQANLTVEARTAPLDGSASLAFHGGLGKVGGSTVAFSQQVESVPVVITSVATDVGPPPPPDLQVLRADGRPRYWSLTASDIRPIKGPIRVCMRYDEGDVRGHESTVRVLQWTGGSAEDITDSRDPATNVVCGTRTHIDGPGDPVGDERPGEPTFFAVAGDKLPGPPRPSGCSLLAGQTPALAGWSSALIAALALFGRRKKPRR